jgi:hypothetical protein
MSAVTSSNDYGYYRVVSESAHATVSGVLRSNIETMTGEKSNVVAFRPMKDADLGFACRFSAQILQAIRENSDAIFQNSAN